MYHLFSLNKCNFRVRKIDSISTHYYRTNKIMPLSLWYVEFKRIGAALSILSHISIIITYVYDSKDCDHDDFSHKLQLLIYLYYRLSLNVIN